jgi:hypothetical protein
MRSVLDGMEATAVARAWGLSHGLRPVGRHIGVCDADGNARISGANHGTPERYAGTTRSEFPLNFRPCRNTKTNTINQPYLDVR